MNTSANRGLLQLTRKRPAAAPPAPVSGCADPLTILGVTRDKVPSVTELHCSGRKLKELHSSFQLFVNLEVLWLNRNELTEVRGLLPSNSWMQLSGSAKMSAKEQRLGTNRLLHLYLSGNKISTLAGDITRLKYLETLLLANNKLTNMEVVVQKLTALPNLRSLDLFGNPLAEEQSYRLYVIHRLPHVQVLDRHEVSADEREAAKQLFSAATHKGSRTAFGRSPDAHNPALDGTPGADVPLSLTAGRARHSHEVVFGGRRWRRIWHQVDGCRGAYDLRPTLIAQLAERATRIHIRTAGDAAHSVTSAPMSWPLQRLRAGRCISCKPDGTAPSRADVAAVWTGPDALVDALACTATTDGSDRPLTRVLYHSTGNDGGLHLITGFDGQCGWSKGVAASVEVYLDCCHEQPMDDQSVSVRELGVKVSKIKQAQQSDEWRGRSAAGQAAAESARTRAAFHREWSRRREALAEQELAQLNKRRAEAKLPEMTLADYVDSLPTRLDDVRDEREKARGTTERKRFLPSHKLLLSHQPAKPESVDLAAQCETNALLRTLPQRVCAAAPGEVLNTETAKLLEDVGMAGDMTAALAAVSKLSEDRDVGRVRSMLAKGKGAPAGAKDPSTAEVAVDVAQPTGLDTASFAAAIARATDLHPSRVRVIYVEKGDVFTTVSLRMPRQPAEELLKRVRDRSQTDPLFSAGAVTADVDAAREVVPAAWSGATASTVSCLHSNRRRVHGGYSSEEAVVPLRDLDSFAARYKELQDETAPQRTRKRHDDALQLLFDRAELTQLEGAFAVTDGSRASEVPKLAVGDRVLCRELGAREWRHGSVTANDAGTLTVRADGGTTQQWDDVAPIEVRRADAGNLVSLCMPGASRPDRAEAEAGMKAVLTDEPFKLPNALTLLGDQPTFVRYKQERLRVLTADALKATSFSDYGKAQALHSKVNRAVDHLAKLQPSDSSEIGSGYVRSEGRRRLPGVVVWFDAARDVGVVRADAGAAAEGPRELAVQMKDVERAATLRRGDRVSFLRDETVTGRAKRVRPAGNASRAKKPQRGSGGAEAASAVPAAGHNAMLGTVGAATEAILRRLEDRGALRDPDASSDSD